MKMWREMIVCGVCSLCAVEQPVVVQPQPSTEAAKTTVPAIKIEPPAAITKDLSKIVAPAAVKESPKDAPKRDPFASAGEKSAAVASNELILHGVVLGEKSYALISLGNNLFTATIKDRIDKWRIHEISFDYVVLKAADGTTKQIPLEQRANDEGA